MATLYSLIKGVVPEGSLQTRSRKKEKPQVKEEALAPSEAAVSKKEEVKAAPLMDDSDMMLPILAKWKNRLDFLSLGNYSPLKLMTGVLMLEHAEQRLKTLGPVSSQLSSTIAETVFRTVAKLGAADLFSVQPVRPDFMKAVRVPFEGEPEVTGVTFEPMVTQITPGMNFDGVANSVRYGLEKTVIEKAFQVAGSLGDVSLTSDPFVMIERAWNRIKMASKVKAPSAERWILVPGNRIAWLTKNQSPNASFTGLTATPLKVFTLNIRKAGEEPLYFDVYTSLVVRDDEVLIGWRNGWRDSGILVSLGSLGLEERNVTGQTLTSVRTDYGVNVVDRTFFAKAKLFMPKIKSSIDEEFEKMKGVDTELYEAMKFQYRTTGWDTRSDGTGSMSGSFSVPFKR